MSKKISKKDAKTLCYKIDVEGFDYGLREYGHLANDTTLEPLVQKYQQIAEELEAALDEIREDYVIEVS